MIQTFWESTYLMSVNSCFLCRVVNSKLNLELKSYMDFLFQVLQHSLFKHRLVKYMNLKVFTNYDQVPTPSYMSEYKANDFHEST